jgi:hypothetical protein
MLATEPPPQKNALIGSIANTTYLDNDNNDLDMESTKESLAGSRPFLSKMYLFTYLKQLLRLQLLHSAIFTFPNM